MMMRGFLWLGVCMAMFAVSALADAPEAIGNDDMNLPPPPKGALVRVWPGQEQGIVKPMHAVNNGPNFVKSAEGFHDWRFDDFRSLHVPMMRTHDARFLPETPGRINDIPKIYRDFDADENDPRSYDFAQTDMYLNTMRLAGTDIMYFLGTGCDFDGLSSDYAVSHGSDEPPPDPAKWARICEHVIRHYNEGWGWTNEQIPFSNQFNITHWEIWNEADLDCGETYWSKGVRTWEGRRRYWNGTPERFFELFKVTATHLKRTFPHLKIGGPSLAGRLDWADRFLAFCQTNSVPLDFFSYHRYADNVDSFVQKTRQVRALLVKNGFGDVPMYLNEWNWQRGWSGDVYRESVRRRGDRNNYRFAASYAATMSALQHEAVDMMMYYDMRVPCRYNGVFAADSEEPLKGYFAFYAWSRLYRLGREVKSDLSGETKALTAIAAKGANGSLALLVTRCVESEDTFGRIPVHVAVAGRSLARARLHMTDELDRYTEKELQVQPDGTATFLLAPQAFAVIELD